MDSAQSFRKLARSVKERENHDLRFSDFVDQPVNALRKVPHGRIAYLRNSASRSGNLRSDGRRIWLNPSGLRRIEASLLQ
jgi:hypothetical protein